LSLVVSLRIPDGIVIAADSLSTAQGTLKVQAQLRVPCPNCKKEFELSDLPLPPMPVPLSTSSFAQKLFPFAGKFGVGTFGMGVVNQRTIYYHMKGLEKRHVSGVSTITEAAEIIRSYFDEQLSRQVPDLSKAPEDFSPLGFQVVGYDGDENKTIELRIGKKTTVVPYTGLGCTISGDGKVVIKLWELGQKEPSLQHSYPLFSLQDAIDHAEFLIRTTADYQRFTAMMPTVGGAIDIALVTSYHDFTWIKRKRLAEILEPAPGGRHE
jgi:hypothetical protein